MADQMQPEAADFTFRQRQRGVHLPVGGHVEGVDVIIRNRYRDRTVVGFNVQQNGLIVFSGLYLTMFVNSSSIAKCTGYRIDCAISPASSTASVKS